MIKNNIGQVENVYSQDGKTNFQEYDFKNNVLSLKKKFAEDYQNVLDWSGTVNLQSEEFETQTTYDALNRPLTITQPDNTVASYVYNKGGLLEQVIHDATRYISNINYNEKGQREEVYYGNNTKTKSFYDAKTFRLKRLLTTRNNGVDIMQDLNYTFDAVGNIVQQNDNAQQIHYYSNQVIAPNCTYTYDPLYRLINATGRELTSLAMPTNEDFANNIGVPNQAVNAMQNYNHTYVFDEIGNMQSDNWKDYVYDTTTNRLLKHDPDQTYNDYTYDNHGNMLTMPHLTSMVWDFADRLLSAGNGTFTSYYNYDMGGDRSRKVVIKNNNREERYYIGDYEIYRKYINDELDTERSTVHIIDDRDRFAMIETETGNTPVVRYQYNNHLGSACLELDASAAIISYEEYHPYGTTSYRSGRTETEVSLKRYKYVGKERDEETGLYYYGARYYAAWLCRFVSVDPLQFDYPHYTPYQYAGNKPISYIDLDGLEEALSPLSFGVRFGFSVGLGSNGINLGSTKLNYNFTLSAGVEYKSPNFQAVAFASASIYGGQLLGTSNMTRGPQCDLTAGAYATLGNGKGSPHNFYTLNYNTASPFKNTFDTSLTYGQMLTYNSAINARGDGPKIQSEGLIGMRFGENFSLSTNNDASKYGSYLLFNKNKQTDAGWTGGIVINIAGIEAGYQNFSGYWPEFTDPKNTYGYKFTAENRMETGQNGAYNESLNKAFNFVRSDNVTWGVYTEAWFQNAIHQYFSNNGTYNYNNQGNTNTTVGL